MSSLYFTGIKSFFVMKPFFPRNWMSKVPMMQLSLPHLTTTCFLK